MASLRPRFLAPPRPGLLASQNTVLQVLPGPKNTVLQVLSGPENTVLQSYWEKTMKKYFGPKYFLTEVFFNPLNPVLFYFLEIDARPRS